jgi:hypothetical protein
MLVGTAPVDELLAHVATMPSLDTETVTLAGAEVLQAMFELRVAGREAALPAGLHPVNPPTFVVQILRCPDTPWGPCTIAQGRVGARSGLRPRGHVQTCVCDNDAAVEALRTGWGFPAQLGAVHLHRRFDGTDAEVDVDGATVLALHATDPEPLGNGDVAYSTGVTLAGTPRGLRLVQVEYEVDATRAERLRLAPLRAFDATALGVHPSVDPWYPVAASIALGSVTLLPIRYVCRPDELAFTGTEPV